VWIGEVGGRGQLQRREESALMAWYNMTWLCIILHGVA
jgi:hypothetical protein